MIVALGSDHAGFRLKQAIIVVLAAHGHAPRDFGTTDEQPCDYPDFIRPAAEAVARGECLRGIVLGGSGNGEAIVANRIRGVRCGVAWDLESALLTRRHNDANVLAMGQRLVPRELALAILVAWLAEPFEGGRHAARIGKIDG